MFTVMELLSYPMFRYFTLVSGGSGLYNAISGTGIFEWESSYEVDRNFEEGEFVVTTLSLARDDVEYAENCLKMLILKKVSAVAIKNIYFKEISKELKDFSDLHNVPILFFSETFFDDIIYTIKKALASHTLDVTYDDTLNFLMNSENPSDLKKQKAREINPFFFPNIICCFSSFRNSKNDRTIQIGPKVDPNDVVYSLIKFNQGLLIIYTVKNIHPDWRLKFMEFLEKLEVYEDLCKIGISNMIKGLENLGIAIQESLYANSSCIIDQKEILNFSNMGFDQILMPLRDDPWMKNYYEGLHNKIMEYDANHTAKLMETLLEYVRSNGDIQLTAKKMFQHSNTIRYRIDKAKKILHIDDSVNSYLQIFIFIRLYEIYNNLDILS